MSATAVQPAQQHQLVELGRYAVPDEARVLAGRRIDGEVYVYDYPASGNGRPYFVECGFESKAELAILLADYRRQAKRLGVCPMSREAIDRAFDLDPAAEPTPPQLGTP
jgi:hypothetical protein